MIQVMESLYSTVDRGWKSLHWVCGLKTCENRLFMRSIPQNRVGIRMGEVWYCSVDCFVKATRNRLMALIAEHSIEMPHQPRVPIGSILLAKSWLTQDELHAASVKSMRGGVELETTLLKMGLIDERQLTSARAMQWGYPVLGAERANVSVESDLPLSLMRAFSAAPLHQSASTQRLVIGFVYRVEHSLLHAIEQATGCRAEPCFITPGELQYQMERLETPQECREVLLDDGLTPAEVANEVGGLAVEVKARETSFSRCREFVWMRLTGQRRRVDVLFRYREPSAVRSCDTFSQSVEEVRAFG